MKLLKTVNINGSLYCFHKWKIEREWSKKWNLEKCVRCEALRTVNKNIDHK